MTARCPVCRERVDVAALLKCDSCGCFVCPICRGEDGDENDCADCVADQWLGPTPDSTFNREEDSE